MKFYLILPDIRSCHNVGAMFRTADACGVDKLYLVGYTATPPKPQIDKVALGAETWIPWEHKKNLKRLITTLKKKGFFIVGLEKNERSIDISELNLQTQKDVVLIVGNEVDGVEPEISNLCDEVVHIPMYGKKESFNVSVAAGIGMYSIKSKLQNLKS
ncbi:MAG: RNA methyltransferase [Candidatus Magasanikbacteria bacterium CG_4_10_14_0_2_um_filter_33_14]|uniref:RNA methyltransferase n=1 Tax=Candidatus Magasanikbacteria bacterium CG_4_10_14_0_2_um_filter_33_14 TaxID=1974636 RepID=A0A2M7V9C7_9BACT|nr:MAG: RNA methyltransferase [Candidatus Magasanikbacteria bacterium CG_4_10_14_0_2_um_filter_33_14]